MPTRREVGPDKGSMYDPETIPSIAIEAGRTGGASGTLLSSAAPSWMRSVVPVEKEKGLMNRGPIEMPNPFPTLISAARSTSRAVMEKSWTKSRSATCSLIVTESKYQ